MDTLNFNWLKSKNKHYSKRYIKAIKYFVSCNRGLELEYGYHIHHIQPKSSGGSNDISNLVKLSIKEHRIIHRFLAKATNTKSDWHSAISLYKSKKIKTTAEYEKWKTECRERMINKWKDPIYRESQLNNIIFSEDRTPWNKGLILDDVYRQKLSEAHMGIAQTPESKKKISETLKSKAKKYTWEIESSTFYGSVSELVESYDISRRSVYFLIKDPQRVIKGVRCCK